MSLAYSQHIYYYLHCKLSRYRIFFIIRRRWYKWNTENENNSERRRYIWVANRGKQVQHLIATLSAASISLAQTFVQTFVIYNLSFSFLAFGLAFCFGVVVAIAIVATVQTLIHCNSLVVWCCAYVPVYCLLAPAAHSLISLLCSVCDSPSYQLHSLIYHQMTTTAQYNLFIRRRSNHKFYSPLAHTMRQASPNIIVHHWTLKWNENNKTNTIQMDNIHHISHLFHLHRGAAVDYYFFFIQIVLLFHFDFRKPNVFATTPYSMHRRA